MATTGGAPFEVERFEYLKASPSSVLLRLEGHWTPRAPKDASLVVSAGGRREVLERLPDAGTAGQRAVGWRAAFSAPLDLVENRRAAFSIETGDGAVSLPKPSELGAPRTPEPAPKPPPVRLPGRKPMARPTARPDDERNLRRGLEAERTARRETVRALQEERARGELAQAGLREELRAALAEAAKAIKRIEAYEFEAVELEAQLNAERQLHIETRRSEAELRRALGEARTAEKQRLAELEEARRVAEGRAVALKSTERHLARQRESAERQRRFYAEAEARARETIESLGGELELEREQHARAAAELDDTRTRETELSELVDEKTRLLEAVRAEAEQGAQDAAALEEQLQQLRDALGTQVESGRTARRFARTQELVDRARADADQGIAQLGELERQVEALRAAIAATAPAAEPVEDAQL